jgi:hypothetical protein
MLVKVVEQALSEAWLRLIRDHSTLVSGGNEDAITDELMNALAALWGSEYPPGFHAGFFGIPMRDGKLPSWDGKSIDQMPDITIYPATPRQGIANYRHDALFFECKVLDKTRGMDLYRSQGIERFTQGRYAWCMPHAGMVAYVLEKSERSPTAVLTNYFARVDQAGNTIGSQLGVSTLLTLAVKAKNAYVSDIAESKHLRSAPVVDGKKSLITLRHLWLTTSTTMLPWRLCNRTSSPPKGSFNPSTRLKSLPN